MKTRFGLIRHGKTRWNLEKRIQGQNDTPLCEEGVAQAQSWGEILEACRCWDLIVSSGLRRAKQTAMIVNETLRLPFEQDARLDEMDWGDWNGLTDRDLLADKAEELKRLVSMGWDFHPPGGENRRSVQRRSLAALRDLAEKRAGENILVVAHGGVIKCLLYGVLGRKFLPEDPPVVKQYRLHLLVWDGGQLRLEALNAAKLG